MKITALLFFVCIAISATAKIKFISKEYKGDMTLLDADAMCSGQFGFVKKAVDINFDATVSPSGPQEEKDELIATYKSCLNTGLPIIAQKSPDCSIINIMIPQGLFITTSDGSYDEEQNFSGRDEEHSNFSNFVTFAEPIFSKYFSNLKVYVWQWNW